MAEIQVEIQGADEVQTFLDRMPDSLFVSTRQIFRRAVFRAANKVKQNATGVLNVRTGTLRRAIDSEVTGNSIKTLVASLFVRSVVSGQSLIYATTHEYGATITAKNAYRGVPGGPYLNIPSDENRTPAGVQRRTARQVFMARGYISGRTVYSEDDIPMFYLVKSVTIPARLGMREAADEEVPTILEELRALTESDLGG